MKHKIIFTLIFISILSCVYGVLYISDYSYNYDRLVVEKDYIITGSYDGHEYEYFPDFGVVFIKLTLFANLILLTWLATIAYLIYIKKSISKHLKIKSTILLVIVILSSLWSIAFGVSATYGKKMDCKALEQEIQKLKTKK